MVTEGSLGFQVTEDFDAMLLNRECLAAMLEMPDNCVDAIVTDPPYGIAFMGQHWDHGVPASDIWAECLRVLKPGGHLLSFAGTRTQHRMACNIEDAGFEIRDMIAWTFGSGFPKGADIGKQIGERWDGWRSALKPALEPITVARKPFKGPLYRNVLEHGVGAFNVDGCRVLDGSETGASSPHYAPNGKNAVYGRGMGGGAHENTKGRYPANLIHDGSDEVLAVFPGSKGQQGAVTGKEPSSKTNNVYGQFNGRPATEPRGDTGSAARFFYCAKASPKDRGEGNGHPTVKPTELMRYLCRLVTPPGGLVLDPFSGSGSTGKAAMLERFRFVGIEKDEESHTVALGRVAEARLNRE